MQGSGSVMCAFYAPRREEICSSGACHRCRSQCFAALPRSAGDGRLLRMPSAALSLCHAVCRVSFRIWCNRCCEAVLAGNTIANVPKEACGYKIHSLMPKTPGRCVRAEDHSSPLRCAINGPTRFGGARGAEFEYNFSTKRQRSTSSL